MGGAEPAKTKFVQKNSQLILAMLFISTSHHNDNDDDLDDDSDDYDSDDHDDDDDLDDDDSDDDDDYAYDDGQREGVQSKQNGEWRLGFCSISFG